MFRTIKILFFLLAGTISTYAQPSLPDDTIKIREVLIRGKQGFTITSPYQKYNTESDLVPGRELSKLNDLLAEVLPVYIKNYGSGGLSTVSLRGASAVHTSLTWNGISIASPMLGQSDISLIPAMFADNLVVEYGSASMFSGSGGFGGNISLTTVPDWEKKLCISLSGLTGSFGLVSGNGRFSAGGKNFRYSARVFSENARNDYRYLNYALYQEPVYERRRNAASSMKSVLQEVFYRSGRSTTSAALWLQASDRNLPSSILMAGNGMAENQRDEAYRAALNHKADYGSVSVAITAGVVNEKLRYVNNSAQINSVNNSATYSLAGSADIQAGGGFNIRVFFSDDFSSVKSVNYLDGGNSRNIFSFGAAAGKNFAGRTAATILVRQTILNNRFLLPDFTAGLNYLLSEKGNSWLKANVSRNSRTPTLNDMFWTPGGNPGIRNEYCWSGEFISGFSFSTAGGKVFNSEISFFASRMRDMIQWLPGENGYWSPVNVRDVNIRGSEITTGITGATGKFSWSFNGSLALTNSLYMSGSPEIKRNQMIYVPVIQCSNRAFLKYKAFYGVISTGYTGKRYTTTDNSRALKPFLLMNMEAGIDLEKEKHGYKIKLRTENLFNKNYELISYYPMQGRSFKICFEYRFMK